MYLIYNDEESHIYWGKLLLWKKNYHMLFYNNSNSNINVINCMVLYIIVSLASMQYIDFFI